MPQQAWSKKRERQYAHIVDGLEERGRTATDDLSSSRRGGLRSHRGSGGRTRAQLYEEARRKNILGRSAMYKSELEEAVGRS